MKNVIYFFFIAITLAPVSGNAQILNKLREDKLKGIDIGKILIFLDSIGQSASEKEIKDAKLIYQKQAIDCRETY